MDTAVADLLSHVMGHYNGGNLGPEILIELLSLCFWNMRPAEPLKGGLPPSRWGRARRAVQWQWALVLQVGLLCIARVRSRAVGARACTGPAPCLHLARTLPAPCLHTCLADVLAACHAVHWHVAARPGD